MKDAQEKAAENKLRGGYYTAPEIAAWLTSCAIRSKQDRVLEPSCGDGVFIESAAHRLTALGATPKEVGRQVQGVELTTEEARKARQRLGGIVGDEADGAVYCGDFFGWLAKNRGREFDCVVGNPPFIRYQSFAEPARSLSMALMQELGLRPNRLTNIWVPFVVGAVSVLAADGRLAMVLPAELLQVSYAAQLRSFLVRHFAAIRITACNNMLFAGAQQEVVLLLASGRRSPFMQNNCHIGLNEIQGLEELLQSAPQAIEEPRKVADVDCEKWLQFFLTSREIDLMRQLKKGSMFAPLSRHASVDVGVVTGSNDFFVLSEAAAAKNGIREYVIPIIGRSAQLKGSLITKAELAKLAAAGERVLLFYVEPGKNGSRTPTEKAYIEAGVKLGVHEGYKCSIRQAWYTVPSVWSPDAFLFRQIHDFPRFVLNQTGGTSTDTIHRVSFRGNARKTIRNLYTHLTGASSEIEGRSYGGGVLELEPTEAERLLVPAVLTDNALPLEDIDSLIRQGRLEEALNENDRRVLIESAGLSRNDCDILKGIWCKMRDRRMHRRQPAISYAIPREEGVPYTERSMISAVVERTVQYVSKTLAQDKTHRCRRSLAPKRRG